jgi:hypothetical protein
LLELDIPDLEGPLDALDPANGDRHNIFARARHNVFYVGIKVIDDQVGSIESKLLLLESSLNASFVYVLEGAEKQRHNAEEDGDTHLNAVGN